MKIKKIAIVCAAMTIAVSSVHEIQSTPTGAPAGVTGSPADGVTCYQGGCHFGAPVAKTGIVSSDIPASGYIHGTTYNITVSFSGTGAKGFQISPQNTSGQLLGSLIAGTGNKIVNGKYVTHTGAKTTTAATWTFKWIAPAAGTGPVTFYCACAVTRNNTWTTTYSVNERVAAGIVAGNTIQQLEAFPNPFTDKIRVKANLKEATPVSMHIYNMAGQMVKQSDLLSAQVGENTFAIELPEANRGMYILKLEQGDIVYTTRIVKK